jgi:hypothetical protein
MLISKSNLGRVAEEYVRNRSAMALNEAVEQVLEAHRFTLRGMTTRLSN